MSAKFNEIRRRKSRRWWMTGATLVAVSVFAIVFAAGSGATLTGSTFNGSDGNLVVDPTDVHDWANQPGVIQGIDQPSGASDNSFGQGTKEDYAAVTVVSGSIPPSKNDLTRFYAASDSVSPTQ